jgi:ADP-ribose pyrophosphatase YjhB (NUDIX family)
VTGLQAAEAALRPPIRNHQLVCLPLHCHNTSMSVPPWLIWARRLQAIAQTGLTFTADKFDIHRYEEIRSIAADMMSAGAALTDSAPIHNLFADQAGYATPKVDVRVAAFRDNQILLVQELGDGGRYTLPGGWADIGEPPSVSAAREVREESGYEVQITKLAAVFDRDRHGHPPHPFHAYKFFFLGELCGGSPQDSHETAGAQFFPEHGLPPLSLSRVTPKQIAHMFEHLRQPTLPTTFD